MSWIKGEREQMLKLVHRALDRGMWLPLRIAIVNSEIQITLDEQIYIVSIRKAQTKEKA